MKQHSEYMPLDVETNLWPGFKSIQEFEQERGVRTNDGRTSRRKAVLTWCILGSIFCVLLVLAILTTKPYNFSKTGPFGFAHHSSNGSSNGPYTDGPLGLWSEGGHADFADLAAEGLDQAGTVSCKGSSLRCDVVNRIPKPEADFRNLSRRSTARRGMVAADSSRCSEIGRDVMSQQRGSAADAAVAVALCQGVVNPVASGLGGGAFIMVRLANGSGLFVDARETAPGAATADMFAGLPSDASLFGPLAIAVPGELQGLAEMHRRFGRLPWAALVAPAADLARRGFAAHPYLVYALSGQLSFQRIQSIPAMREAFLIKAGNGSWRLPRIGELCCRRPQLAETLDKIAADPEYLSRPAVAAVLASELAAAGGIIRAGDFAAAAPAVREPLKVQIGEVELLVPPPPSSAAVVAFALKFLAGYGNTLLSSSNDNSSSSYSASGLQQSDAGSSSSSRVAPDGQPLASFGVDAARDGGLGMQRLVEAMKHGFAIRTALGDPGTAERPFPHADAINAAVRDLLDDSFVEKLRAATRDDGVLPDDEYGGRWNPRGVPPAPESGTSHFSIVDEERNAVSVTTSINAPFGAGVVSPSTGILYGNTMDDFAQPNKSSFVTPHPSEANFIAPGKRPLSAMSPIIASHRRSGRLLAVAGASGGPLIVSATLQTLARLLLEGADVAHAVSAPRVHDQLLPQSNAYYENYTWGFTQHQVPQQLVSFLKSHGQQPTAGPFPMGVSQAISVSYSSSSYSSSSSSSGALQPADGGGAADADLSRLGLLLGASDARKDGAPLGY
ncbi:hypothetical protein OEZ86_007868 [Tetradesmus obliquus]|nr:hypothetical protein OEZ86_007868 [Tetradesmus obliquus]